MIRYTHTNLIARDWRALASFYETVLNCVPLLPERDHRGPWLDTLTGLSHARLRGIHLRLPGHGENGPTLEIFSYDEMPSPSWPMPNTPGLAHLAFAVDNVAARSEVFVRHGGTVMGPLIVREIPEAGRLFTRYLRDPEGNIVELQKWEQLEEQEPEGEA
jgi:predicted enzyme related to lactoylglutathione lyase